MVGRESSNIVDDDSVNKQVHDTHGRDEERLTVKKAAEGEETVESEEQEAGIEDDDNPWAFSTTQAKNIGTTLKTAQIGYSALRRGLSPPAILKPISPDGRASMEHGSPSRKIEKFSDFTRSAYKLKHFIADVNQMANR